MTGFIETGSKAGGKTPKKRRRLAIEMTKYRVLADRIGPTETHPRGSVYARIVADRDASKGQISELHLRVPADVALEFGFSLLMLGGNLLFERHFPVNEPRRSQVE